MVKHPWSLAENKPKYQVQISPTTITYIGLTSNVKPALVFVCKKVFFLYLAFCI